MATPLFVQCQAQEIGHMFTSLTASRRNFLTSAGTLVATGGVAIAQGNLTGSTGAIQVGAIDLLVVATPLQIENVGTIGIANQKDTVFGLATLQKTHRNANEAPSSASTNMQL